MFGLFGGTSNQKDDKDLGFVAGINRFVSVTITDSKGDETKRGATLREQHQIYRHTKKLPEFGQN